MQPLARPFGADPPQALIDAQLAHMIESPELDDFEEVREGQQTVTAAAAGTPKPCSGPLFACGSAAQPRL
jgi:hypothetical protein